MADPVTPSTAAIFDASSEKKKPDKPDEGAFKAKEQQAEKEHKAAKAQFEAIRDKINNATPAKGKNPRREELISQMKEIREKQAGGKGEREKIHDQIRKLDEKLKSQIAEQKNARSRVNYKSTAEIDAEITRLEKEIDTGKMKLVDERKALTEVSALRKTKKTFAGFDESQKQIDDTKAKIKSLRDSMDDPESKALGEKYNKLQTEFNSMKAEQDEVYGNIKNLRDEREKLYKLQQEKYLAIKTIRDEHWQQKRAFDKYEYEARQRARERKKAEDDAYQREKRRDRAEKILAEARDPAYMDEIRRAQSLLHYFDPSSNAAPSGPLLAPSGFAASASRTVDGSDIKGTRVVRKEEKEEDYFKGTGGKKGKKGKKGGAESPAAATTGKFSCPPSVMEDCSAMGIDPPMSAADIPAVVEKVKAKLDHWKADQKAQTDRNVTKAQKDIEKLDAEDEAANGDKPNGSSKNGTIMETIANSAEQVKDAVVHEAELAKNAVSDIAADLQGASIKDSKDE